VLDKLVPAPVPIYLTLKIGLGAPPQINLGPVPAPGFSVDGRPAFIHAQTREHVRRYRERQRAARRRRSTARFWSDGELF